MPTVDPAAAATVGRALRRLRYTEDTFVELLGEDAYSSEPDDVVLHAKRLPKTPLGDAARLLLLGFRLGRSDAVKALGADAVAALEALGLTTGSSEIVPLARITAVQDVLLASDLASRGGEDPPDYVAAYTPTARLCDMLTPRPRVARALDVGTGSGIHALLAARHARRVIATDVNPRALAYTDVNAALNGLDNVETRRGSLFEPVDGETFQLIVCNPPFVVSPENRWTYRDNEFPADELSEQVVSEAAARLEQGGFATMLVSWVAGDADEPDERPLAWVRDTGCDAWILATYGADPLAHAGGWNDHLAEDLDLFRTTVEHWENSLRAQGIAWISEGAILLHKRSGPVAARVDTIDEHEVEVADRQVRRAFAARAAGLRPSKLVGRRLELAPKAHVEQDLKRGKVVAARVLLEEGTHPVVEIPARLAEPIAKLGGKSRPRFRTSDGRVLRELLELGVLRLR